MNLPEYLSQIRSLFHSEFSNLSFEEINWKPGSNSWSIGQCLDHIIATDRLYLKELDKTFARKYRLYDKVLMPIANRYLKSLMPYVSPTAAKPTKTFGVFQPSKSDIQMSIIETFDSHLSEIERAQRRIEKEQHKSKITHSPVNRLIFIPCDKVPELLSLHARRHLEQALRIKQDSNFILHT